MAFGRLHRQRLRSLVIALALPSCLGPGRGDGGAARRPPPPAARQPEAATWVAPPPAVPSAATTPAATGPRDAGAPPVQPSAREPRPAGKSGAPAAPPGADGSTERPEFQAPLPPFDESAPAMRLANLSPAECREELRRRKLPVTRHKTNTPGIANALRISGPLHGVTFVTPRAPSPFGLLDCRLALALDEVAPILAAHGVAKVYVGNIYRKGARIARRRRRSQHSYGLALDVASFRLNDGRRLVVERDFHGSVGDDACGAEAEVADADEASITLRNLLCAIARARIFHHILTPCGDYAHRNHLHFDIKRDAEYHRLR